MKAKSKFIAFVAHSFAPEDLPVVNSTVEIIRHAGVSVLSGERPEARGVSRKIKDRIKKSNLFIALMTHRHQFDKQAWTTSPWVIEEKGYSLGQNSSRPIIALIEEGIPVPDETGGLEGDLEIIFFNRKQFEVVQTKLRQILADIQS